MAQGIEVGQSSLFRLELPARRIFPTLLMAVTRLILFRTCWEFSNVGCSKDYETGLWQPSVHSDVAF
jgi:hypothetical protein